LPDIVVLNNSKVSSDFKNFYNNWKKNGFNKN
jgi:hypothetical protein